MIGKRFSPDITALLDFSREEAVRLHNDKVSPTHLLLAMMRMPKSDAVKALSGFKIDFATLRTDLERNAKSNCSALPVQNDEIILDNDANRLLKLSVLESKLMKSESIDVMHLLLAIMRDGKSEAAQLLAEQQVSYDGLASAVMPQDNGNLGYSDADEDDEDGDLAYSGGGAAPVATARPTKTATPALDNFGTDLTHAAEEGLLDPVVGREKEIERVAQILCRRKKNNPILIGEPGVGKSAIVEGLAMRIVQHKVSRVLWDKRVVMLDLGAVVAGTKYRGQFEERIRAIMQELQKNPNIIIFIDEIHTMVGAGNATGTMDAANMLKPALARGEIQCVGATTVEEFRKTIEKDGALERRFQKVMVNATTMEETLQILKNLRSRYEEHHNVTYTDEALEACVQFTERYVTDRCFPDKAIDVMDEAGSKMRIQDVPVSDAVLALEAEIARVVELKKAAVESQNFELAADYRDRQKSLGVELEEKRKEWEASLSENRQVVDAEHVAAVVSMMTGIPVQRIGEEENVRLRDLSKTLTDSVVGQDEAVAAIARAIQRSRIGLKDPNKPIGTFLFVGPTGVGKTYLTKKLAEVMFGSEDALIRVDMSEYMEKHTVSRMVGAPPGYVGYDEGGQLTEKVRRRPYSIVLLDEIEKAHQDVFNMLLQVMDDGRLTDGNGTTISFKNTIIIMTSNSGTRQLKDFGHGIGFSTGNDVAKDKVLARSLIQKSLQKQFAPEFLNRLDDIVYFDQLSLDSIKKIVGIELRPLLSRIKAMGYDLAFTEEATELLAKKGYDVQYGARPLKRAMQTLVEDKICQLILDGEVKPGDSLVASADGEEMKIGKQE